MSGPRDKRAFPGGVFLALRFGVAGLCLIMLVWAFLPPRFFEDLRRPSNVPREARWTAGEDYWLLCDPTSFERLVCRKWEWTGRVEYKITLSPCAAPDPRFIDSVSSHFDVVYGRAEPDVVVRHAAGEAARAARQKALDAEPRASCDAKVVASDRGDG